MKGFIFILSLLVFISIQNIACQKVDLFSISQQIGNLETQNDSLLKITISMQRSLDSVHNQINLNTSVLNSINSKVSNLQSSVITLIGGINAFNLKIDSSNNNITVIQGQLGVLTKQYQVLSNQITSVFSSLNLKIDSLSNLLNTDTRLLNNLQIEYLQTQIKVDSLLLVVNTNNQLLITNNTNLVLIQAQLISLANQYLNVIILLNQLISTIDVQAGLSDGLIAYYPFNGNANDLSGNGLNGLVYGAALVADRNGTANNAYSFNGINNYIKVNHDTILNTLPISISVWFDYDASTLKGGAIISKYSAASWNGWNISISPSNGGRVDPWYLASNANNVIGDYGNPPFYVGSIGNQRWHNVVFTVDGISGGKLFLDGNLVITRAWVGNSAKTMNSWPLNFGLYIDNYAGNAYYKGLIDDIRIYKRVLTQAEITYLAAH